MKTPRVKHNPEITIEPFEVVKKGHTVSFSPRHAVGGPRGLRKALTGQVVNLDAQSGLAQIGDWLVPVSKVRRLSRYVHHEWARAERKAQRQKVYGGLAPAAKRALAACAKDARTASLYNCLGDYSGPMSKTVNSEMKRCREKLMRERGIEDTSDQGQCKALPLFLERALASGKVPILESVGYGSAETGDIGVGDTILLGGEKFKIASYTPEGKVVLKDGVVIEVPMEYVPRDKAAPVKSVLSKLAIKREKRLKELKRRGIPVYRKSAPVRQRRSRKQRRARRRYKWCYCFGRDRQGRFTRLRPRRRNPRSRVIIDTDLLGRKIARLEGHSGKAEQIPLFEKEHTLTAEEKAARRETETWRARRDRERAEGQRDLFSNPPKAGSGMFWLGVGVLGLCLLSTDTAPPPAPAAPDMLAELFGNFETTDA